MTREEQIKWLRRILISREDPRGDTKIDVALKCAIKVLEKEPNRSEKPNKWIPVSEGLPEDNTLVLVTVKVGNREPKVRSGYYYMNGHFHIDNGDCWEARDKELIAWMPLPEPYKQEVEK